MNLMSRLKRLEKDMSVNDKDVFIIVGDPSYTLYGSEARAYYEQEVSSGRLSEPKTEGGFNVHRSIRVYLPEELEG